LHRRRFFLIAGMILAAAAARLLPHPPNFTPIGALALFGGACLADARLALLMTGGALLLSDLVIGPHDQMAAVYAAFALVVVLGRWVLRRRRSGPRVAGAAVVASILFFLVSNFGVWLGGALYPRTLEGLAACYVAAIPFFGATLLGDVVYAAALFGGLALVERRVPALRQEGPA
jgi:hypothetical protein